MSDFTDTALEIVVVEGIYRIKKTNKALDGLRLKRLEELRIPRVYDRVWLSKTSKSKIQAVAIDGGGKKQYYYSKEWEQERGVLKRDRFRGFIDLIPHLDRKTRGHKSAKGWPKNKTMAYMLDILKETNIRVGNKKYLDKYNSYGLTTIKKEHVTVNRGHIILSFKGKHGVQQTINITNKSIIRFIKQMLELPEDWVMKYQSKDNNYYRVSAQDLNNYLHELVGPEFTVKDYRTWGANMIFLETLLEFKDSEQNTKKIISLALERTAKKLGNNKATSKNSYVMEYIIKEYQKDPQELLKKALDIVSISANPHNRGTQNPIR